MWEPAAAAGALKSRRAVGILSVSFEHCCQGAAGVRHREDTYELVVFGHDCGANAILCHDPRDHGHGRRCRHHARALDVGITHAQLALVGAAEIGSQNEPAPPPLPKGGVDGRAIVRAGAQPPLRSNPSDHGLLGSHWRMAEMVLAHQNTCQTSVLRRPRPTRRSGPLWTTRRMPDGSPARRGPVRRSGNLR